MHTNTGEIASLDHFRATLAKEEVDRFVRPIDEKNLPTRRRQEFQKIGRTKIGRNEPCPCGSGRKFKRCCLAQQNILEIEMAVLEQMGRKVKEQIKERDAATK